MVEFLTARRCVPRSAAAINRRVRQIERIERRDEGSSLRREDDQPTGYSQSVGSDSASTTGGHAVWTEVIFSIICGLGGDGGE
ncbi:MAG: hypothetical protein O7D33_00745 [Chloroflexi bacterium]|nr:hypothetical protein [Chloroflexota bacterium]